jgi:hypothetical protein
VTEHHLIIEPLSTGCITSPAFTRHRRRQRFDKLTRANEPTVVAKFPSVWALAVTNSAHQLPITDHFSHSPRLARYPLQNKAGTV